MRASRNPAGGNGRIVQWGRTTHATAHLLASVAPTALRTRVERAEEDEQLIGRLATGDTTALDPLYDRYAGLVFALVLRILGDRQAAEDLLQEVFVRAWQLAGT
jgi:hypothetical protein